MLKSNINYLAFVLMFLFSGTVFSEEDKYASVRGTLQTCTVCHGESGVSETGAYPILAGQEFYYIYVQLKDFKSGLRQNDIMSPLVANLEKSELKLMAEFFSKQEWPKSNHKGNADTKRLALKVVNAGQCAACHLGSFAGNSRNPRLANQHKEYLSNTMFDFKNRIRKNAQPMNALFATFSDEEITALADYLHAFKD
ncbi:MAG: cytochrome c553 [Planctomycetota bacterium]|jgi:cytochrome c553